MESHRDSTRSCYIQGNSYVGCCSILQSCSTRQQQPTDSSSLSLSHRMEILFPLVPLPATTEATVSTQSQQFRIHSHSLSFFLSHSSSLSLIFSSFFSPFQFFLSLSFHKNFYHLNVIMTKSVNLSLSLFFSSLSWNFKGVKKKGKS